MNERLGPAPTKARAIAPAFSSALAHGLSCWFLVLTLLWPAGSTAAPDAPAPTRSDAAAPAPPLKFAWDRLEVEPDPLLTAGETGAVRVLLRNRGLETWDSTTHQDFLSYHLWQDREGRLIVFDGARTPYPRAVAPGESVELWLKIQTPLRPGPVLLEVSPVREHVLWFPPPLVDATGLVELEIEPPSVEWDLLEEQTPSRIPINRHLLVTLRLHNTGTDSWLAGDNLAYHWLDLSGQVIGEGLRTPFPAAVAPGSTAELSARLETPARPGDYLLRWEPVREGVRWFGPAPPHANDTVPVTITPPELAWRLVDLEALPPIWVNHSVRVEATVRNEGSVTWSEDAGDHLSYHWLDEDGQVVRHDGRRTRFPHPVGPGEAVEVSALIQGPKHHGSYKLQWEMVREHVKWYGPPVKGPRTLIIETRRRSTLLQLGLVALTFAAVFFARRRRRSRTWGWFVIEATPLLWTWAATFLAVVTFSELSALEFWKGAAAYSASGAVLPVLPLLMLRGRRRMWIAAIEVAAINTLAFADLIYMHFFGAIVPVGAFTAAHQAGELGASIAELAELNYLWLIPTPVAGLVAAMAWPRPPTRAVAAYPRTRRAVAISSALLCLVALLPFSLRLQRAMVDKLGKRVYSEARNASRLGFFNAHVFDLARTLRESVGRRGIDSDTREQVGDYYLGRAETEAALADHRDYGAAAGANLLVIQVEAAQGFIVDAEINGQEITPFLNGLDERGLAFPNIIDQSGHGKTSDAEYLTLTSNHGLKVGALAFLRADNEFVSIAHILRRHGYSTLSAHPYKRGFWNRAVLHPRYGFERSLFRRELGTGQAVGWGLADGLFFRRVVPELEALPKPFFAFLVTLSLHHPYDEFADNLKVLDIGELEGTNLGNYVHAMHYFDRSLRELFDRLNAVGLLGNTVIAVYGDHDARLPFDTELLGLVGVDHWSPSVEHRFDRIPLFVVLPQGTRTGVVRTMGGQLDIAPTLLHYLGIARPHSFLGRALVSGAKGRVVAHPDGSAFTDDRMFVAHGRDIPRAGGCFAYPRGTSRPVRDCAHMRDEARIERTQSRRVLNHDLQTWLGSLRPTADPDHDQD